MKNNTKNFLKAGMVLCIAVLFVGSSAAAIGNIQEKVSVTSAKQTATLNGPSRDETELKYYMEEGLSTTIGIQGGTGPYIWKTAIRLTQDEMAAYSDWTMKSVNVASEHSTCPSIGVRIYIYDKGTTATKPGPVIVSDTTTTLDTSGITTIPLVTPVNLSGHEELWVAVEWTQMEPGPGVTYAWMDTLTGPAIDQKGDFYYLNNVWGEIQTGGPDYDGNWGIGAIIEGAGLAVLSIGNIKGPVGVKADISNIGDNNATDIEWSMTVTGGLLGRINVSKIDTYAGLAPSTSTPISSGLFIGFGKISIVITASAKNANEVSVTKSALVLGPLVIGIK